MQAAAETLQKEAAVFLSTIANQHKVSETGVKYMVKGFNSLTNTYLDLLKEALTERLIRVDGYITVDKVIGVIEYFRDKSMFEGVQTFPKLMQYTAAKSSQRPVAMQKLVLSHRTVWSSGAPKLVPHEVGYVIPFLPQLEQLLNCKDVLHCIENPRPPEPNVFKSTTDGYFYRYHPIVLAHQGKDIVLDIRMYFDDVEPCDPLKSKGNKHNQRMFYWILGNVYPELRSSLKAINLMAIVNTKVAKKYGNHHFIKDFMAGIKILGVEGALFKILGAIRKIFGVLCAALGDNPAMANLAGMKETFAALRGCRTCLITSAELCIHTFERVELMRTKANHEAQLKEVLKMKSVEPEVVPVYLSEDEDNCMSDEELVVNTQKMSDHRNPSINYGINRKSDLAGAPGFDVTKCFPHDIQHVLAEGVVEQLCRTLLKEVCFARDPTNPRVLAKNVLPLETLNHFIANLCNFGHLQKNQPSKIEKGHIFGSKLKQSAAQMIVLAHVLPFIIHNRCSDEKLQLLLLLLKILRLCMSFELNEDALKNLNELVSEFISNVMKMYPNWKTLKLHFLVHLASQTRLHGPPRQSMCFRFEAFHQEFTGWVNIVRTKKDLSYSVGKRHLMQRNGDILASKEKNNFLYPGDKLYSAEPLDINTFPDKEILLVKFPDLHNQQVIKMEKISQHGRTWEEGTIISLENSVFGRISQVLSVDQLVFLYNELKVTFKSEYDAYEVDGCSSQTKCCSLSDLKHPFPVVKFTFQMGRAPKTFLLMYDIGDF